jgi:leader peptidase (prepilin peptidase)/N-methyltransferase
VINDVLLVAVVAAFGLLFGSFANVAIHRWPRGGTVATPRSSTCPACGHELHPRDNVPVVSWLALRGRCRYCRAPVHWRYPVVEVVTAVLFAAVAAVHGWTGLLPALLVVTWSCVVATAIDLEFRIIPNRMTFPLAPVVLALVVVAGWIDGAFDDVVRAVAAGLGVPLVMFLLSWGFELLRGKAGIGMGDIKWAPSLTLVVGYLGGWELVGWFYATIISAGVVAIGLVVAGRAKLASRIPYGPYLAVGTMTVILAGGSIRGFLEAWLLGV